jgi:hydrogenase maturation protease
MARLAVLALGNVLMGDDGFGPFVVAALQRGFQLPPEVAVLDLGTPGLALGTHLELWEGLVLVDALAGPRAPGRLVVRRGPAAIAALATTRAGAHEPGVHHALLTWQLRGGPSPDIVLIGAVSDRVELGGSLTPALHHAARCATALVVQQLGRWGATLVERADAWPEPVWWEATTASRTPCTR